MQPPIQRHTPGNTGSTVKNVPMAEAKEETQQQTESVQIEMEVSEQTVKITLSDE